MHSADKASIGDIFFACRLYVLLAYEVVGIGTLDPIPGTLSESTELAGSRSAHVKVVGGSLIGNHFWYQGWQGLADFLFHFLEGGTKTTGAQVMDCSGMSMRAGPMTVWGTGGAR